MRRYFLLVLSIFPGIIALAQQDDSLFIKHLSDEILANGKAYDNLRELTKKIGGRLSGSPQMVKAEAWGAATFRASGADKVWMQECMVPHWIRGGKDQAEAIYNANLPAARNTGPSKKKLDVLALGNSMGTGVKGLSASVILVNSFDELEAKKDELKGKIVFYNYKFNPTFISTFQAYGDAVRYRGQGASRAAKYGARAVIVRSMSHSTDNFPHTGAMRYDSTYPLIPAVAIGLKDADWLSSQLQEGKVSVFLKTGGRFLKDTIGHNIIGELTGSEFPDQYITVGGHLDSWDPAEGAHDDGAGIVQTIEILRAFKAIGFKPRHTIRFVLFANEENGLRGGNKYAEEAKTKNEKHIFALESDAGGFMPRGFGFNVNAQQLAKAQSWQPLLAPFGAVTLVRGGDGSDIGPLHTTFGIPTAGLNPDSQRYFDYHHSANDVFENVNKRELELGSVNMAALIYLVDKYGL
jgi:hypothetical protein